MKFPISFFLLIDWNVKTPEDVVGDSSATVSKAVPQLLGQSQLNGTFQQRELRFAEQGDRPAPS